MIDECGLQQGFSYRFPEIAPPTNFTSLQTACKRQARAFVCLKAYAKCLQPLSKQILLSMIASRQKYNKEICHENISDAASKLLEYNKCMHANNGAEKAIEAEINSIIVPEAIINTKFSKNQDRINQSCCSVSRSRDEYMAASSPRCSRHSAAAATMIDSYLSDSLKIICPNFDSKLNECDKLPKLTLPKQPTSKSFVKPIIGVVQALAP